MSVDRDVEVAPTRAAGLPGSGIGARWPRRRWVVTGVLTPLTTTAFLLIGWNLPDGVAHPGWDWVVGPLSGLLAAAIIASYVPHAGSGRLIEVGCSPCALASGAAVAAAGVFRATDPTGLGLGLAAVAVLAVGLARRLTDSTSCQVPTA